jgi:micrococcal nuclease
VLTRKQKKKIFTTLATLTVAVLFSLYKGEPLLIGISPIFSDSGTTSTSSYRITHIVDGDTVDILRGEVKERLRLIGVNSPESVDPRRPVECFGKEASKHAAALLAGQSVSVVPDPSQGSRDKYGRTLAYIFLSDGTNFNELMIRDGYAYEYTYDKPYRYQDLFKIAEREAKAAERGLWASTTCAGIK